MKYFYFDMQDFNNSIDLALNNALQCATVASKITQIHRIVILVPTQRNITTVDQILLALGYRKNANCYNAIGENINIIIESKSAYNHFDTDALVFFCLNSDEMFIVEQKGSVKLEVGLKEFQNMHLWQGTWDAVNPVSKIHIKYEPSPKAKAAFDALSFAINRTNNIVFHPSDEDLVKKYIRTLHAMEPAGLNPDEVFAYLMREKNWTYGLCKLVHDWIDRLNNGRTFKGGTQTKTEMKVLYSRW